MIICITGLAGSGKSTACSFIKEHFDVNLIQADKIGHKLLELRHVKDNLIKEFGNTVILNGKINRTKLKDIVFKSKVELNKLNKIVHPLLIREIKTKILKNKLNLIDAALFYELQLRDICDKVILIKIKNELILERNPTLKDILKSQRLIKDYDLLVENNNSKEDFFDKLRLVFDKF